jgi:hypothetical protein
MNNNTRISVHCYEGDAHQIADAKQLYLHHECPVTVISPTDSPAAPIEGLEMRNAGQRDGSVEERMVDGAIRVVTSGPIANQRQIEQMKLLLTYPEDFFLMNDADSFCLSPQIPKYVYDRSDIIWCNYVHDPLPANQPGYASYPKKFPHAAMQPPYFLTRRSIERLIAVADQVVPNKVMPWIDHFMLQLAWAANVEPKRFLDSVASDVDRYPENLEPTLRLIRNQGCVFVHSSKSPKTWQPMIEAHNQYLQRHRT